MEVKIATPYSPSLVAPVSGISRESSMQARWICALRTSVWTGSTASARFATGMRARATVGSRLIPMPSFIHSVRSRS